MLAVGGNSHAAVLSGISVPRTVVAASDLRCPGRDRRNAGGGTAAVGPAHDRRRLADHVVRRPDSGGAALTGGHVSVLGTFLGVLVVALITNALVLLAIDPFLVQLLLGPADPGRGDPQPLARGRGRAPGRRPMTAALDLQGAVKTFPGVKALDGVELSVARARSMRSWVRTAPANRP